MKRISGTTNQIVSEKNLSRIKRAFDILISICILVFIFPWVYIFIWLCIKLTMPGRIFFLQKRTGIEGSTFICYKFRTMKPNCDADLLQAYDGDPRITPFGKFLRDTSLDEMPQFWNVLKGDMSIVGPRPHMLLHTSEYEKLIPQYVQRLAVRPGITGWAQVNGLRGETENIDKMRKRVEYDIWYIRNWSIGLDLKIIFRTIKVVWKAFF